ncbi:MAG: NHLP family bacteriocin export ABC transporter peptidase/permease/ATPase subunit [Acidobacteriota bacterium]
MKTPLHKGRAKTPTVIQMEAVECGAAALAIVLGYYGRHVPLEQVRIDCGVSRDGSKASNVLAAARRHGMVAKGFRRSLEALDDGPKPAILFWNFNHFIVLEGIVGDRIYINDPASGPRRITRDELDQAFTGVVLELEPGPEFKRTDEIPGLYTSLRRLLSGSSVALTLIILATLGLVIPGVIVPVFAKVFVDEILVAELSGWAKPLLLAMALTALVRMALTALQQAAILQLENKLAIAGASRFLWHVLRLPIVFFTQRSAGDINSRVALNDRVATLLSGDLATAAFDLVTAIFFAIVMLTYDVRLTLIVMAIAVLDFVVLHLVARKRKDGNMRLQQELAKLTGVSMGGLQIIETLKASGNEGDFFAHWAGYQSKAVNSHQELGVPTQILSAVPGFLSTLSAALVLGFGALEVMAGSLTMGGLVAFQTLAASFLQPVNRFVDLGSKLQDIDADLQRLHDVLRYDTDPTVPATVEAPSAETTAAWPARLSGRVELDNVTFGYSRLAKPLIENFSLHLEPGSRVALVGASGSGKSTIAKLVVGLYPPWSGKILLDGHEREELPRWLITHSMATVDQDIFLFEGSVAENLAMWDRTVPFPELVEAARDADIHTAIAARPGGYDSPVSEGGGNFSGGQRQRLEIARALVTQPSILVLDEATSALDPLTELEIDRNLRRRGCTCLIIAHRLSTIRDCDEIIVLERGHVVERGTHDELFHAGGHYHDLVAAGEQSGEVGQVAP